MNFQGWMRRVAEIEPVRIRGRVRKAVGLGIQAEGLAVPVGAVCEILPAGAPPVRVEVVGFQERATFLMPLGNLEGVRCGDEIVCRERAPRIPVGRRLLGRVVDAEGHPLDGGPPILPEERVPLEAPPPPPMGRPRITEPLGTGVRAIDALHTCGRGQRVGLFSGSGVGKSTLLGMCARYTAADVSVVALVGERGREVRDFVEKHLGPEGLRRSVVVAETSDRPALRRVRAALAATAVAEYFRDQGADVLLLMDSLTRVAAAQREIGLSAGEPPATKGYPPSVFGMLPRLLERAGRSPKGSITGLYTVLVESDDVTDPIADAARAVLDGHLWLSRELAHRAHYPAVDPLESVSRLMVDVAPPEQQLAAARVKALWAAYREAEDLIHVGAYVRGSNPDIDAAIRARGAILRFLRQDVGERSTLEESRKGLLELVRSFGEGSHA